VSTAKNASKAGIFGSAVKALWRFTVNRFAWMLCALMLMIALAGCQSTANGVALQVTPDNPQIFRVGSDVYTLADYERRLKQEVGQGIANLIRQGKTREEIQQLADQNKIRAGIFERMVQDTLLMQYARRNGIGVDPLVLDTDVFAQPNAFDPTKPFSDTTTLRVGRAQNQIVLKVLARNTRADMIHARQIIVENEAAADQILADLKAGTDFTTLATKRSMDTATAATGGDQGWTPKGDLPADVDAAGFTIALKTPTKVQAGHVWYVIEVLDRQVGATAAEKRPFDSFEQLQKSQNGQQFYQETFQPWYDQLRKDAEASGELTLAQGFDPNTVPLPFPAQ
jgi:peptidyl-prolyl cis-trans isomerase C